MVTVRPPLSAADEPDEDGSADDGGHDACRDFTGEKDHAADDVGADQQDRGHNGGKRQDPPVVRASQRADGVRNDEAQERDRSGYSGGGSTEQDDAQPGDATGQGDVLAEAAGNVIAQGKAVQDTTAGQDDQRPRLRGTAAREGGQTSHVRRCCYLPETEASNVSWLETRMTFIRENRPALRAAPARASLTGVAPSRPREATA